jgi:hypothetical protein
MLAVMITFGQYVKTPPDVPVCDDWRGLWQLFTYGGNFPMLSDPAAMLKAHEQGGQYVDTLSAAP